MIIHLGGGRGASCRSLSILRKVYLSALIFSFKTRVNHIMVQNPRNDKIKVCTYLNIHVYKIYEPSELIFGTCWPLFMVIEKWGILAWFCDTQDGVLLCKCHKLKYIYENDIKQSWLYHFRHQGKWWATKIGVICRSLDCCRSLNKKRTNYMNYRYYLLLIEESGVLGMSEGDLFGKYTLLVTSGPTGQSDSFIVHFWKSRVFFLVSLNQIVICSGDGVSIFLRDYRYHVRRFVHLKTW